MRDDTMDIAESFNRTVLYLRSEENLWGGLLVTLVLMVLAYFLFRFAAERALLRTIKETKGPVWAAAFPSGRR